MTEKDVVASASGRSCRPVLDKIEDPFVLVVHTDKSTRNHLREMLNACGMSRILEAEGVEEAGQVLRCRPINLLVCDLQLSGVDGWRLARLVRCGIFGPRTDVPIVLTTSGRDASLAQSVVKRAGLADVCVLPLEDRALWTERLGESVTAPAPATATQSILILERDVSTASLAARVLRRDFHVDTTFSGPAGLQAWLAHSHDLVLLATDLPDRAALAVLQDILRLRPKQGVVLLAAKDAGRDVEELMLAGATELVSKPFTPTQLRRTCEFALYHVDRQPTTYTRSGRELDMLPGARGSGLAGERTHLLDSLDSIVLELDAHGQFRFLNKTWETVTGHTVEESVGRPLSDFLHPEDRDQVLTSFGQLRRGRNGPRVIDLRLIAKSGDAIRGRLSLDHANTGEGQTFVWGHVTNVLSSSDSARTTEPGGTCDALTGLFNRTYFHACLERLALDSASTNTTHAILHIDLDHFKVVNDTLGPSDGDVVLREVARFLAARAREPDLVFRVGGDEFVVLLKNVGLDQARRVAEEMLESLAHHSHISNALRFTVTCSIGVAAIDGSLSTPARYHTHANKASFIAKSRGRNRVHVYSPLDTEHDDLWDSIGWSSKLREAISDDRLQLYLQPVLDTQSGQLMHYEALLRLHLPNRTHAICPGAFIPGLERVGQISALDRWVVEQAVNLLQNGCYPYGLAINLSAHAFEDARLLALIKGKIADSEIDPTRVIFEITETAGIANIKNTRHAIADLRALGCRLALDDFGTGFCSFSYLRQLPADFVKLDGSYIRNIASSEVDLAMVRSVNEISHLLGKKTIAECVETQSTLDVLREIGVDYVQGFSIGRPLPVQQLGTGSAAGGWTH